MEKQGRLLGRAFFRLKTREKERSLGGKFAIVLKKRKLHRLAGVGSEEDEV